MMTDDRPIWEQLRDAPVYDDIEADQAAAMADTGYMEVSAVPYHYEDEDDQLLTDALPRPPAASAGALVRPSPSGQAVASKGLKPDGDGVPLPKGWEMKRTADGRPYYIDHNTKTTTWVRPVEGPKPRVGEFVPLPKGWEFRRHPKPHFLDHNTRTSHVCDPRPLPEGWEQRVRSSDGVAYFVNHAAKTTQWYHPCDQKKAASIEVKVDAQGRTYYVNHDTRETSWDNPLLRPNFFGAASSGLPPGWEKRFTPEGRPYYVDHRTHQTRWDPPR